MRITIFLFIVGFCLVSAKYLSYETKDSNSLRRIKRSDDSDDSSGSVEEKKNSSENDDDDDDDEDKEAKLQELEDKIKRKALEHKEKEKRKKEEEQRKLEEKKAKAQRKEEEKRQKEERKRIERLEKKKRKEEEKLKKEERKKQEKQRKELEKLEKEAAQGTLLDIDSLETEEENSVELNDIWKEHIYVKYGLTLSSSKLEKQAALNKYLQEELGLNQNSTEKERFQAVVQLIQTKLQTDTVARTTLRNQLLGHINAVSIQKWRSDIEKDLEELNNKTEILNNVTLLWVPTAKQQIEEKRSFLETISQFLSNILPNWITGGQNAQKPIGDSASAVNKPVVGGSNGPNVNSENNFNSASGSNVASGNSDVPVIASQTNDDAGTESNVSPSSVDKNSTVQSPSQIPTEGSSNISGNNINENTKPLSTNIVGSGNSNDATEVNKDILPTGEVASVNIEISSEGNSPASANDDNAPSVDNSVVPSENTNDVPAGSTNIETTSVPQTVGSGDTNSTMGVSEITSSTGEATTVNSEIPSEGNSVASENGDNALSVDNSVVPSENINDVPAGNANSETTSLPHTVGTGDSNGAMEVSENTSSTGVVITINSEIPSEGNSAASGNSDNASSVDHTIVPSENNNDISADSANTETTSVSNTVGSGDNYGATGVAESTSSTGEVISINSEIPSEGSGAVSENGDNALSGDNNIVPSENNVDVPTGSANNEITSVPNSAVNPILSSTNVNADEVISVSTTSITDAPLTSDDVTSSANDKTTNAGESESLGLNSNNADSSLADVGNSVLANPTENQYSGASEAAPDNSGIAESSSSTDNMVPVNPNSASNNGVDLSIASVTDDSLPVSIDVVSSGINDAVSTSGVEDKTSHVTADLAPSSTSTSQGNAANVDNNANVVSPDTTESNVDKNPSEVSTVESGNIDNAPSVTLDVISSSISDNKTAPINDENLTSDVAENVVGPDPTVIAAEGNGALPDNNANISTNTITDGGLNENPGVVISEGSEGISIDSSNLPSTTVANNASTVNSVIVSTGNSDITVENVGSPSSSVAGDIRPPNSDIVYAEDTEIAPDNTVNTVSTSLTDNITDASPSSVTSTGSEASSSNLDVKAPSVSIDIVSSSVTESSSSAAPDLVSSTSSSAVNKDDVLSSSTVDNTSPANIVEVIPEVIESANSVNNVPSNGINNVDVTPVNNDKIPTDIIPPESTVTLVTNDPAIGSGSIDILKITEAAPEGLPDTTSDLTAVNMDTTIAPEIINSVQTQENSIDSSAQVVSIVTENPVESEMGNEPVTVVSDIISNVNTVSIAAAEISTPSEAPQVQTTPSSVVDTVAPVELPAPVVIINGITIPDEPGASVVEILPQ